MPHSEESSEIARIRAGDRDTFEAVFRAQYGALCEFALRYTGGPDDAEELVAETFANVWGRRASLPHDVSLVAYLYRAVRNRALNLRRDTDTRDRAMNAHVYESSAGTSELSQEYELEHREIGTALARLIRVLPERRRTALILRWYHGLSYAEIAVVMDISVQTVANQISRTLADLRERFPRDLVP